MGRKTRQRVGWQPFRPTKGYVADGGVARSPVGVPIAPCGISDLEFGSCTEGVQGNLGNGRCVSWRRKP